MRFLVYSDLQATEGSSRCFTNPDLPLQRHRVIEFFKKLETISERYKCDALIDLGDTTDDRSFIPRATLDCMLGGLSRFAPNETGIKLTGNHEQLLKYADVNSKHLFEPYFGYIDPPVVCFQRADRPSLCIVCQPYHEDYDEINRRIGEELSKLPQESHKILLAHGDVRGVKYDSGEACKKGIDPELIVQFDLALLGHIHRHQKIGENAFYVGSPFQQDFGEANQLKFVAILDCTNVPKLEWVPISGMPEYRVVDLETFLQVADPKEEHRYSVTLSSIEETERFYADPRSVLGSPKLTYVSQLAETQKEERQALTDRQLLERYAALRPISGVSDSALTELVDIGEMLLHG